MITFIILAFISRFAIKSIGYYRLVNPIKQKYNLTDDDLSSALLGLLIEIGPYKPEKKERTVKLKFQNEECADLFEAQREKQRSTENDLVS